jgi:transposase
MLTDRAVQHYYRSAKVKSYLSKNNVIIRIEYFPKGSPEFNPVEECWKQGKEDLLVSKYYLRFTNLKTTIAEYYRTKRFNLNMIKYLL